MSVDGLKAFALLAEFGDGDRENLHELLEEKRVARGRRLFSEGSESEGLILLRSGKVRLESRRGLEPEFLPAGAALGAISLISVGPREVTAFAEEPCEIWVLPRESWPRLVGDHPATACRLAEALVRDLAGLLRLGLDRLAGA